MIFIFHKVSLAGSMRSGVVKGWLEPIKGSNPNYPLPNLSRREMILVKPSHKILFIQGMSFGSNPLHMIEIAGRTCYKSEDKITEDSAQKFVAGILKRGHESVIEHSNITVKIICDRGVTHAIVRHRLCAYSQESRRYCNYKGGVMFVRPPWVDLKPQELDSVKTWGELYGESSMEETTPDDRWLLNMSGAEIDYMCLIKDGWSPQQARSVLPNSLKTEIVMTANIREWRHILKLRTSKAAHPQMVEVMEPILTEFRSKIPVLFDDI